MIRIDGLYTRSISDPSLYIIVGDKAYMTSVLEYRELNMSDLRPCAYPVSTVKHLEPVPKRYWNFRGLIGRDEVYYCPNKDCPDWFFKPDEICGQEPPVCLSERALKSLAEKYGSSLADAMSFVHEASDDEIKKFSVAF